MKRRRGRISSREVEAQLNVIAYPAFKNSKANPYNALLYREMQALGVNVYEYHAVPRLHRRMDVLHLHWPELPFGKARRFDMIARLLHQIVMIVWYRAMRTQVVWTVHNLEQHEGRYTAIEDRFRAWFFKRLSGVIFLAPGGKDAALERFPILHSIPSAVIPHGHYGAAYANTLSMCEARTHLRLDQHDIVLLFIGQIRPYKNVPELLRQFSSVTDPRIKLIIAGVPNTKLLEREITALALRDERVQLYLTFIVDDHLQVFLKACDGVILPYRSVLNSGASILALTFKRRLLAPAIGAIPDLQRQFGSQIVQTYDGAISSAVLESFARSIQVESSGPNSFPEHVLKQLDWHPIAEQTVNFYQSLLKRR